MAEISKIKLPDGKIYDIKNTTYKLMISDDGTEIILKGSDGKTSSVPIGSGGSSGRRCRLNTSIDTLH